MNKIQDQFRKLFWQYDLESLRGFGVPEDEYDSEADMAFEVIKANDSIEEIEWKVISVFGIWFSPSKPNEDTNFSKPFVPPKFELLKDILRLIKLQHRYGSNLDRLVIELKNVIDVS